MPASPPLLLVLRFGISIQGNIRIYGILFSSDAEAKASLTQEDNYLSINMLCKAYENRSCAQVEFQKGFTIYNKNIKEKEKEIKKHHFHFDLIKCL